MASARCQGPSPGCRHPQLTSLRAFCPPPSAAPPAGARRGGSRVPQSLHSTPGLAGTSIRQMCGPPLGRRAVVRAAGAAPNPPAPERLTVTVGGREVVLESGEIGRQANGAVMIRDGETMIYTTACCALEAGEAAGFVPFSVNYTERFSAVGKTSGSYFKREGRPTAHEMLVSRLTDRPLRPLLPKGWSADTQVLSWLMSYDGQHQPEPLAITAAGAALAISDIPLAKAVAGVRVGLVGGEFVVNPTVQQQAGSSLDLVMGGSRDAILMIEGACELLPEETLLEALRVGSEAIAGVCVAIDDWAARIGRPKRSDLLLTGDASLDEALAGSGFPAEVRGVLTSVFGKHERGAALAELQTRGAAWAAQQGLPGLSEVPEGSVPPELGRAFKRLESGVMRELVLAEGVRADGRGLRDVRPISARCGLLPRTHGSVLFTRGETQAIAVATLGSSDMELRQDLVGSEDDAPRRFYLQYNFPPSSVGETGRVAGPGRREVGHGMLAERALAPVIPDEEAFPYTVRVESTITESNGSSSMASVCGGCLALQDAGVPIKDRVAGVAMGLVLGEGGGGYAVLTDILGSEDALGDMDFKVAGSADGVSAFQMDIKVEGISLDIMREALAQAKAGRLHILQEMGRADPAPRGAFGPHTPRIARVSVDASEIGTVIGPGGKTIRSLREDTGCNVQLVGEAADAGVFEVVGDSDESVATVVSLIQSMVEMPEVGKVYTDVQVAGIEKFGLFVEFLPGRSGLLHVSELAAGEDLSDFDLADRLDVQLLAVESNRFKLGRRFLSGGLGSDSGGGGSHGSAPASPRERPRERPQPPAPGTLCENVVVRDVKPYGVFVEISPGVSGLVHQSELWLDGEDRGAGWEVGDAMDVVVLAPRDGTKKQSFSRRLAHEQKQEAAAAA